MVGQGRPRSSTPLTFRPLRVRSAGLLAVALWAFFALSAHADEELGLRIVWGGGPERVWQGSIAVSQGRLGNARPLGIEADEAGSMWLVEDDGPSRLVVRQKSRRNYDGVDLTVAAPQEARLLFEFSDDEGQPHTWEVPLATILAGPQSHKFDEQGNRLVAQRAPGDSLRVHTSRESLVFAAGETFSFTLEPRLLPVAAGTRLKFKLSLSPARTQRELWSMVQNIAAGEAVSLPVEVPLREAEGAYDLTITATTNPPWAQAMRQPLVRNKIVAERKVQLLVMQPKAPATTARRESDLTQVALIDPAAPRGWESTMAKLPAWFRRVPSGPWGNGAVKVVHHTLGEMAQLAPNGVKGEVSWEAYILSAAQPGRPHIVEVEYPSDVVQTLGISVLEPDVTGGIMPFSLDSGVDVAEEIIADRPKLLRHRIVFWPRTANPILLLTNHRDAEPAQYGKIRLMAGWEHLPPAPGSAAHGQRTIAAYYDRPLFPENFSASRALDEGSGFGLDDWVTFHESGLRLTEYLRHVGYNTLVLSAMAEGSALYPSRLVEPTPRFDRGTLFAAGHDTVRKDVLEMLYRLCDRDALQLVAGVDFSAPLPALEARLREGGAAADGLVWIGSRGETYQDAQPPRRGLSPYYNTLHPDVQAAMLAVVGELAERYKQHASFGGIAVQLSTQGYAQLPGPQWGLDDATIARFEREARVRVPGKGENRFAARAEFLAGPGRAAWLQWRAETLACFYRAMQKELTSRRREARLYLCSGNTLIESQETSLRPSLVRKSSLADALLRVGLDPHLYAAADGPVLLRPEPLAAGGATTAWAAAQELAQWPDVDRCFAGHATTGSHFLQQRVETRLTSFDEKSPFKPTYTLLITHAAPSDRQNRRRFVHSLATLDAQALFDGGWLLPLGQEEALRGLLAAYRRLPAVRMERVADAEGHAQPVVFRSATYSGQTYVYAVNDSPLRVSAQVRIDADKSCQIAELSGLRKIKPLVVEDDGLSWSVDLAPYDLVAVSLSQPGVQLSGPQVAISSGDEQAIAQRIRELGGKATALRSAPPLKTPDNAGFEETDLGDVIPGWAKTQRAGVGIARQAGSKHSGEAAVQLLSAGPVACLVSKPFAAPTTGRISMSVWLRTSDPRKQPPLRLAFEGRLNGETYYRYAELGRGEDARPAAPLTAEWAQYVFPVNDLPLDGLTQFRVRFDLMGEGEVFIDDVQLSDLSFTEREHRELAKLITVAQYQLQSGRLSECLHLLDGYWPTFLARHAPAEPATLAKAPKPAVAPAEPPKPPAPRTGLRDKLRF